MHVVKGHSMQPAINDGSRVVVLRWAYILSQPKAGDVVVFHGNDGKEYVKRIIKAANNSWIVEGDNKSDSKKLPAVKRGAVIGRVIWKC